MPSKNTSDERWRKRFAARIAIILALRNARSWGVTNLELNKIQLRYSATIFLLRKQGWKIVTERVNNKVYRFILDREDWLRDAKPIGRRQKTVVG